MKVHDLPALDKIKENIFVWILRKVEEERRGLLPAAKPVEHKRRL
jgi:hypothetical protein